LSIVIGIALGIVSALRQYSPIDYGITFMAFLFFSLPVFWVAVLLKEFGAIQFNNFLRDPSFSPFTIIFVGVVVALAAYAAAYGTTRTRAIVAGAFAVIVMATMAVLGSTGWLLTPFLGIPGILVVGGLISVAITFLIAGFRNKRALYAGLTSVLVAAIVYFPIQGVLSENISWPLIFGLGLLALAVGAAIGYAW